jgi:outer membrane protein OmpA-like peptidoglycan-associated protein
MPSASSGIALEVENDLPQVVCYLKMSPSSDSNWGNDWLGEAEMLATGAVRPFTIPAAVPWDIRAEDCQHNQLAEGRNLALAGPSRIHLASMTVSPIGAAPAVVAQPVPVVVAEPAPVATPEVVLQQAVPVETPPVAAAVIRDDHIEINQTIQFEPGSATIREESTPILTQLAEVMRAHPEITRVRVEGHTDARGNAAQNQSLSTLRANAVVTWLRGHQVTATLDAQGFGSSRALCAEDVDACHQRNRRVEFFILR